MIKFFQTKNAHLNSIVFNSFKNSFNNLVTASDCDFDSDIIILVNPSDDISSKVLDQRNKKIIIFGNLTECLLNFFKFKKSVNTISEKDCCADSANSGKFSQSPCLIKYSNFFLDSFINERFFERFDFNDEWNNLNYGSIKNDGSIYSLSNLYDSENKELAIIYRNNVPISVYSAIRDTENLSILWINRAVG